MNRPLALIVDDEPDIRELLEITLGRMKIDTISASDLASARQYLQNNAFNLCLTDLRLPDGNGLELVEEIGTRMPHLPVAVITAYGSMETAIQALKTGAFDFITKPIDLETLRQLTRTALKLSSLRHEPVITGHDALENNSQILGVSESIQNLRALIHKLARNQAPVHITGESGTGKELAARLIHSQGPRREFPFIPINCGAIPSELMESEFFGHKKGSFTGAFTDKQGLFQAAESGTLFLDEVADLPLHMQVKLLRAIQEKTIRPVGEHREIATNIRLISATHKNLSQLVESGQFRQDLYYRIHVIGIEIPPLRNRPEDVPLLAEHILERFALQSQLPNTTLTTEAMTALCNYSFPGNVRELANILERALALSDAGRIRPEDLMLPCEIKETKSEPLPQIAPAPIANGINMALGLDASLEQVERQLITKALKTTNGNDIAAAKQLGISLRALRYRIKKLGFNLST